MGALLIDPVRRAVYRVCTAVGRIRWNPVGKVVRVGTNVRQVFGGPTVFVDVIAFDGGVDSCLVVFVHLLLGGITRRCDPRNDDRGDDAKDRDNGQQFEQ